MEEIRAFIALELPDTIKASLSKVIENLETTDRTSVKWVNPENIHLTLKFLGNIPTEKVADLASVMDQAVAGMHPLKLQLNETGAFPNLRSPRVIWAGLDGDTSEVGQLKQRIDQALSPLGFPADAKPFSPHLTLGRVKDKAKAHQRQALGKAISTFELTDSPTFRINEICLIKSTLTQTGAIYDRLSSITLDKNPER